MKSFKVQEDEEEYDLKIDDKHKNDSKSPFQENSNSKNQSMKKHNKYFHCIRYAIQNASIKSNHVNMKPCYGSDLTPSSGCLLDAGFNESSLPEIEPPHNDFHTNLHRF